MRTAILLAAALCAPARAAADSAEDRFVAAAESGDHRALLEALPALRASGSPLGVEHLFFEALALAKTGRDEEAEAPLRAYLDAAGPAGAYHEEALALDPVLREARAAREKRRAAEAARAAAQAALSDDERRASERFGAPLRRLGRVSRYDEEWGYAVLDLEGESVPEGAPLAVLTGGGAEPASARAGRTKGRSLTFTAPSDAAPLGAAVYAVKTAAEAP